MLRTVREPAIRPHPGTRPMALLVLAFGVAIGGALAGTPERAIATPDLAPATVRSGASGNPAVVAHRPVRVIPLPLRNAPSVASR